MALSDLKRTAATETCTGLRARRLLAGALHQAVVPMSATHLVSVQAQALAFRLRENRYLNLISVTRQHRPPVRGWGDYEWVGFEQRRKEFDLRHQISYGDRIG